MAKSDVVSGESDSSTAEQMVRGGLWARQKLYGGERLTEHFAQDEQFILRGLKTVGVMAMEDGKEATKTELEVSSLDDPKSTFTVGTLSGAIAEMAHEAAVNMTPDDLPAVVHWTEVETKRKLQNATVIVMDRLGEK